MNGLKNKGWKFLIGCIISLMISLLLNSCAKNSSEIHIERNKYIVSIYSGDELLTNFNIICGGLDCTFMTSDTLKTIEDKDYFFILNCNYQIIQVNKKNKKISTFELYDEKMLLNTSFKQGHLPARPHCKKGLKLILKDSVLVLEGNNCLLFFDRKTLKLRFNLFGFMGEENYLEYTHGGRELKSWKIEGSELILETLIGSDNLKKEKINWTLMEKK